MASNLTYYVFNKPYGILSQFTDEGRWKGLGSLGLFPSDVYPIGRLDADSEGLLILTNDRSLNQRLLNPKYQHTRTYWVQVDHAVQDEALDQLKGPLELNYKGKIHRTLPAKADLLDVPNWVRERVPPIRQRAKIPTTWISLELKEGKNRQVRKMTAKVGHPTLRLIRYAIEDVTIEGLVSGEFHKMKQSEIYPLLKLSDRV